jgi:hypothetical protein
VAFRSSRAEPYGEAFLRRAIERLLKGDAVGVRVAYLDAVMALRRRELATRDVSSKVRLTKTPEQYAATRESRREMPYEAMLSSGRRTWSLGDRVRVYRTRGGGAGVVEEVDEGSPGETGGDPRDYDVEHYVRLLRDSHASRLARAFAPRDYEAVFADPTQLEMFAPEVAAIRPILTRHPDGA